MPMIEIKWRARMCYS